MKAKARLIVTMEISQTVEIPDYVVQKILDMEARGESKLARVKWAKTELEYAFPIAPRLGDIVDLVNTLARN